MGNLNNPICYPEKIFFLHNNIYLVFLILLRFYAFSTLFFINYNHEEKKIKRELRKGIKLQIFDKSKVEIWDNQCFWAIFATATILV